MASIEIKAEALALLNEMATDEGVTPKEYLEALINYAVSCDKRPGSWEGAGPFNYSNYDDRHEDGAYADRWF